VTPQEFLDEFGTLAESAEGVPKLRELILELAVRGKLVEQDESEEPAKDLVNRITAERDQLVADKVLKKSKPLPDLDDSEYPIAAPPKSWCFDRMGNLFRFIDYRGKTPPKVNEGVRLITAKNVRMGFLKDDPREFVTEDTYSDWMTRGYPATGDLLFTTEAPMGNVCRIPDELIEERFALAQRTINLHPYADQFSTYLMYAIMSRPIQQAIADLATGMTATGIKAAKLKLVPLPVPPLAEQHRIVSKVDELMGLCDRLEAVQGERRGVRVRLNRSSLDRLTSVSTARGSGLSAAWQRVCDHFEVLYDTPETLPDLRQTILQLAVQGKLVPQDPNDEPAEELIKRINAERDQLVSEKVVKKAKPLPELIEDEFPIDPIPPGWHFERMGTLFRFIDYRGKTPTKVASGVRLITAKNVRMGFLKDAPREFVTEATYESWMTRGYPTDGDLLFTTEAPMGNICQIPLDLIEERFALAQRTINLHPYADQHSPFLMYSIMSQAIQDAIAELATGMTATGIKAAKLKLVPLPIPPLSEQKRIVSKVTHLLSQVTRLESTLTRRESTRTQLLTAAIHSILNDNKER